MAAAIAVSTAMPVSSAVSVATLGVGDREAQRCRKARKIAVFDGKRIGSGLESLETDRPALVPPGQRPVGQFARPIVSALVPEQRNWMLRGVQGGKKPGMLNESARRGWQDPPGAVG
jgi:hypothetical protein